MKSSKLLALFLFAITISGLMTASFIRVKNESPWYVSVGKETFPPNRNAAFTMEDGGETGLPIILFDKDYQGEPVVRGWYSAVLKSPSMVVVQSLHGVPYVFVK